MNGVSYEIYLVYRQLFLNDNKNIEEEYDYLPLKDFEDKNEAISALNKLKCSCKPYKNEYTKKIGYVCYEYELTEEDDFNSKTLKYNSILSNDDKLTNNFFRKIE